MNEEEFRDRLCSCLGRETVARDALYAADELMTKVLGSRRISMPDEDRFDIRVVRGRVRAALSLTPALRQEES